jgi:SOS-response transcriptional repressor LexA
MVDHLDVHEVSGPGENQDVPHLTERESKALGFIIQTFSERGSFPAQREIHAACAISISAAHDILQRLSAKGYLRSWANGGYSILRDLSGAAVQAVLVSPEWADIANNRDALATENQELKRRNDFLWRCIEAGLHVADSVAAATPMDASRRGEVLI